MSSTSNDLYDPIEGSWIWRDRLPSGTTISSELGQVLDKMLQPLVKNRYKSADEVLAELADKRHSPSEKQEESNNVSIVGAWSGKFGDGSKPASLIVTEETGNSFKGILSVREPKLDFTYRIEIDGDFNTETSSVSIQEKLVISDHWFTDWRRGKNEGTISKDGKRISGGGKDRKDSYSWEFIKIDYNILTELLSAKKWKEADRETGAILLKISCREKKGRLDSKAIEYLPCPDLRTIDTLWLKYSNGRFGFSVQKRIWNETRDWKKCGDSFGWRVKNDWKDYSNLNFTINAPTGAFPTFWGGEGRKVIFGYYGCWEDFFSRLSACGL